jgi:hypothetical protein
VAAAGVRLGPEAAIALGAAGRLFESLAERAWEELRPDARQRAAQMLSAAAEAARCDDKQLGKLIGASETTRLQTALAMSAAERTAWPPKVRALGKVLAAGLIAANDAVDLPMYALDAMVELDRLHVSLLDLLVRYEPEWASGVGYRAQPHRDLPDHHEWVVGQRIWTAPVIAAIRPQLQPVLTSVTGSLVRHGLAEQTDRTREALEQLEHDLKEQVNQQAAGASRGPRITPPRLVGPVIRKVERSWSPTELGEQVLGFYFEAAALDSGCLRRLRAANHLPFSLSS